MTPEPGWGNIKLGICTPPIKTDDGWFTVYHGVRETASGNLYRLGAILLDLKDPSKVIGRTPHFIFGPEEMYERTGDVPNVVFPFFHSYYPDLLLALDSWLEQLYL